jgi:integrase
MDLADRLEGQYPKKTLSLMHGAVLPERSDSFADVLDYYAEFKQTGYGATDHRLKVRIAKCKADLIEALGAYKIAKQPIQTITRKDANAYRDTLSGRMSANSVARYKNTLNAAYNWYIKENGLEITSPFAGLLIKGAGSSKVDRLPLQDAHIKLLEPAMKESEIAWALYVLLRDTGARVAEIAGLRVQDCDVEHGVLQITPSPWRRLKNKTSERSVPLSQEAAILLKDLIKGKTAEEPVFERYAKDRGMDNCSQMLMKRLRTVITDKKLTMHSLRHRMKDKLRNTGCPEAISMAILGHGSNTVAANYGSGYALDVMREHMEKVWA